MSGNSRKCKGLEDADLIGKALTNIQYFGCIYERYEERLTRYILKISGCSNEEADDIMQESFVKVWKNLNSYQSDLPLSSWLFRIVHNETISYWRKKSTRNKRSNELTANFINSSDRSEQMACLDSPGEEKEIQVQSILHALKKEYREVLVLKYFENMSYGEISDILRIPEGTVAIRLNRAKKSFATHSNGKINLFE